MQNVGGFFASLKLVTDDNSIQQGLAKFGKIPGSLKGIALGALGVAAGMVALEVKTASSIAKLDAQARALGMGARVLDNWKTAIDLAGGEGEGFVGTLNKMNNAFQNLKIGDVDESFIKNLGLMGINFNQLMGMDNDKRVRTVFKAAEGMKDEGKRNALLNQFGGQDLVTTFYQMIAKYGSFGAGYNQADERNPKTEKNYQSEIAVDKANREIGVSLKNELDLVGIEIGQALLPNLKDFSGWLVAHKQDLADFATAIGNATTAIIKFLGFLGIFSPDRKMAEETMAGGAEKDRRLNIIEKQMGIEKDSLDESLFFLNPLGMWPKIANAKTVPGFENAPIVSAYSSMIKSPDTKKLYEQFAAAVESNSGLSSKEKYAREAGLGQTLYEKPNLQLVVNIDKDKNVEVRTSGGDLLAQSSNTWTGKR